MISASGSNPLERCSKCTLILQVIQLMNDPGPEALADPTLIMLRELHLGGTVGHLANSGTTTQEKACCPNVAHSMQFQNVTITLGKSELLQQLHGRHHNQGGFQSTGCGKGKWKSLSKTLSPHRKITFRATSFKILFLFFCDDASYRSLSPLL